MCHLWTYQIIKCIKVWYKNVVIKKILISLAQGLGQLALKISSISNGLIQYFDPKPRQNVSHVIGIVTCNKGFCCKGVSQNPLIMASDFWWTLKGKLYHVCLFWLVEFLG